MIQWSRAGSWSISISKRIQPRAGWRTVLIADLHEPTSPRSQRSRKTAQQPTNSSRIARAFDDYAEYALDTEDYAADWIDRIKPELLESTTTTDGVVATLPILTAGSTADLI